MSKTGQIDVSVGAMLPNVRGQMCSRAEYGHSLNAMRQVLHTTVSSGEKGTFDNKSSFFGGLCSITTGKGTCNHETFDDTFDGP